MRGHTTVNFMNPEGIFVGAAQKLMVRSILRYSQTGHYRFKLLAHISQFVLAASARSQAWAEADRSAYWRETFMRNENLSDEPPNEFVARYQNVRDALQRKD
jgi:hypothetical protein